MLLVPIKLLGWGGCLSEWLFLCSLWSLYIFHFFSVSSRVIRRAGWRGHLRTARLVCTPFQKGILCLNALEEFSQDI